MYRRIQWTDDKLNSIQMLLNEGLSVSQVAKRIRLSKNTLYTIINRFNLVYRYNRRTQWPDERVATAQKLLDEGLSIRQVADKMGLPHNAFISIVRRYRLKSLFERGSGMIELPKINRPGVYTDKVRNVSLPLLECLDD